MLHRAAAKDTLALDAEYTHEDLYAAEAKAERIRRSSIGNGDPDERADIQRKLNAALEDVQRIKRALGRAEDAEPEAKDQDQVPQDCFDAQILGV